jgi:hypothetical protein
MKRGTVREGIYASQRRRVNQYYGGSGEILGGEDRRVLGIEADATIKIFAAIRATRARMITLSHVLQCARIKACRMLGKFTNRTMLASSAPAAG